MLKDHPQDEDALEKEVQDTYDTLYEAMVSLERVQEKTTLNSAIAKAVEIETNLNLYMTDGKKRPLNGLWPPQNRLPWIQMFHRRKWIVQRRH